MVAATTMKQRKRHVVTLTWPEELGQCTEHRQGRTPVSVFKRFTSVVPPEAMSALAILSRLRKHSVVQISESRPGHFASIRRSPN
jgi:hypothetical protein